VRDFLGEEICENPVVKNSILTVAEKDSFDTELTIQELDKAINELNVNSAGGEDGISMKFLKQFWPYLRGTFIAYAKFSIGSGKLSQSMNSAVIKLIPKKGDLSKIKNWRPISLLNCSFKIIAKAVDNRLKKINEIVLSRSQKGFTNKRYIQECMINIIETIAYSEKEKVPSFVLALDMAKAFDTVRHSFAKQCYKFFGIGDYMIKMLETVSLGTGFPQGSPPSPNQFNIQEQILIFKIELDPRIKRINFVTNPLNNVFLEQANGGRGDQ
jgi:hypothetical protein